MFANPVFIVPGKFSSLDLFSRIDVFLVVLMDLFSSELLAILLLTIIRTFKSLIDWLNFVALKPKWLWEKIVIDS